MRNKKINTLVLGLACFGMLAGASVAVSAQPQAQVVEAESEYTINNTSASRLQLYYNTWLTITLSDLPAGTATKTTTASSTLIKNYNYKQNVYCNGDPDFKAFDVSKNELGFYIKGDNQFTGAANPDIKSSNAKVVKTITIPAGTEFPSYDAVFGSVKEKYVTTAEVTFYNLNWAEGSNPEFTIDSNVNRVAVDVEAFGNDRPNPGWPGFKLSQNDFGGAKVSPSLGNAFNYFSFNNIQVTAPNGTNVKLYDALSGAMLVNYNANSTDFLSFGLKAPYSSDWNNFKGYRTVCIPAGTEFPSNQLLTNVGNVSATKTIYYTTEDIFFYCSNTWGNVFTKVKPQFVENTIKSIGGLHTYGEPGSEFSNFVFDLGTNNKTKTGANRNAQFALTQAIANATFYDADNNVLDITTSGVVEYSYGIMFGDYDGSDYLVQIKTTALGRCARVVFKAGVMVPSIGYLAGENNVWYKTTSEFEFINVAGVVGSATACRNFVKDYMHPEVGYTTVGTGSCISEGWYSAAKAAFNTVLTNYDIVIFANTPEFNQPWVRLNQWAAANGETFQADFTFHAVNNNAPKVIASDSSALVVIATAVSMIALLGFVILKKKHQ